MKIVSAIQAKKYDQIETSIQPVKIVPINNEFKTKKGCEFIGWATLKKEGKI